MEASISKSICSVQFPNCSAFSALMCTGLIATERMVSSALGDTPKD